MSSTAKVSGIVIFGLLVSFTLPHIITTVTSKALEAKKEVNTVEKSIESKNDTIAYADNKIKRDTAVPVQKEEEKTEEIEEVTEEVKEETKEEVQQVVEPAPAPVKSYAEMTTEELISAIATGTFKMEYSGLYDTGANKLEKAKGAIYYNNHKETYYSERVLPGTSLRIPGRHTADDGTVRDGDGYICVAANSSYLAKGTVVKTSLGPAKVYDSGCASGIIDIYTNW